MDGNGQSNPLEALSLQAHSSMFLPLSLLGGRSGSGPPLMFTGDTERERNLAVQAVAHLGSQRLAGYPELLLRSLELQVGRELKEEDPGGSHSPASPRNRWPDEAEEETGKEEAKEEE